MCVAHHTEMNPNFNLYLGLIDEKISLTQLIVPTLIAFHVLVLTIRALFKKIINFSVKS